MLFETLPGSMLATWRSDRWPIEERMTLTRLRIIAGSISITKEI